MLTTYSFSVCEITRAKSNAQQDQFLKLIITLHFTTTLQNFQLNDKLGIRQIYLMLLALSDTDVVQFAECSDQSGAPLDL